MTEKVITAQQKGAATRAEKKIRSKIAAMRSFTGQTPATLHVYPKDFDALEVTGQLARFGVHLVRATSAH